MDAKIAEGFLFVLSKNSDTKCFNEALEIIIKYFNVHMGTIHRFHSEDQHLYLVAVTENVPEKVRAIIERIPFGKGIAGQTAEHAKPFSTCNLIEDKTGVVRPGANETNMKGALCVPIMKKDTVIGTLGIGVSYERGFTTEETEELTAFAKLLTNYMQ